MAPFILFTAQSEGAAAEGRLLKMPSRVSVPNTKHQGTGEELAFPLQDFRGLGDPHRR